MAFDIGYVEQSFILHATLREDIAYGVLREQVDRHKLNDANAQMVEAAATASGARHQR